MFELSAQAPGENPDGLFLERLDAFCLAEMKAFSEREHRPFEEVSHSLRDILSLWDSLPLT